MESSEIAPFRVSALPFDVRPGEVKSNLQTALDGLARAAAAGAKLLLLPEKWTTSFLPSFSDEVRQESDDALARMHEEALAQEMIVVGSAPGGKLAKPYNELHFLGAAGNLRPYRKRLLFSPTGEGRQCVAGEDLPEIVPTSLGACAGVICYDLRFPEVTRPSFYAGVELFLVPAQWPVPRDRIFELMACARAAENQCWLLACNRAGQASLGQDREMQFPGVSLLVDPIGLEAARSEQGELLIAEVDPEKGRQMRRRIPCARDLRKANLWPSSEGPGFAEN